MYSRITCTCVRNRFPPCSSFTKLQVFLCPLSPSSVSVFLLFSRGFHSTFPELRSFCRMSFCWCQIILNWIVRRLWSVIHDALTFSDRLDKYRSWSLFLHLYSCLLLSILFNTAFYFSFIYCVHINRIAQCVCSSIASLNRVGGWSDWKTSTLLLQDTHCSPLCLKPSYMLCGHRGGEQYLCVYLERRRLGEWMNTDIYSIWIWLT